MDTMNGKTRRNILLQLLFLAALIGATFWWLLRDCDVETMLATLKNATPWLIGLGLLCMGMYLFCGGSSAAVLFHGMGRPMGPLRRLKYHLIEFFFSAITPSSSGGQPFEVLFMRMDGYKVTESTVVLLVVAVLYLFFGTELGCGIRATGCNPVMSRAQGINTDLSKVIGLSLSNGLVALSGALLCQYQGYADINMGRGAVVIGLAAVVIGEAVVKHISPNFAVRLTGVLVGAVIYYLVYQVIIFVGFDTDLLKMFSALVVAAFLGVPYVKKQLARKHHVKGGIRHA